MIVSFIARFVTFLKIMVQLIWRKSIGIGGDNVYP